MTAPPVFLSSRSDPNCAMSATSATPNEVDRSVGNRLRLARILAEMPARALAAKAGLSEADLLRIERGDVRAGAERLFRLSQLLAQPTGFCFKDLG